MCVEIEAARLRILSGLHYYDLELMDSGGWRCVGRLAYFSKAGHYAFFMSVFLKII